MDDDGRDSERTNERIISYSDLKAVQEAVQGLIQEAQFREMKISWRTLPRDVGLNIHDNMC